MAKPPVGDRGVAVEQLELERTLSIRAGDEGKRFVQRIAQTCIEIPVAAGVVIAG